MTAALHDLFSDLPPATEEGPDSVPGEARPPSELVENEPQSFDDVPGGPICPTCNLVITREPGARGRLPKYHAHCRPTKVTRGSQRGAKALEVENEVEAAVSKFRGLMTKAAILLSLVDSYDAFVVAMNTPDLCNQFAGICEQYPKFRRAYLGIAGKGSILGFAGILLSILLPIAAHHKLIPIKFVREALINLPNIMFQLNRQVENGPERLAEIMFQKVTEAQAKKRQEEAARRTESRNGSYVNASNS